MSTAGSSKRLQSLYFSPQIYGFATVGLRLALVAGGLVGAYLLYGLFAGLDQFSLLPAPDRARVLGNLRLAGTVFVASGFLAAVFTAFIYAAEEVTGYAIALLGSFLYVGVPFLLAFFADTMSFRSNPATATALAAISGAGVAPLALGGLMVTIDVVRRLIRLARNRPLNRDGLRYGEAASAETIGRRPFRLAILGKCWEGRFCRDFVRVHCPIFKARKACWRVKRGCYCEEDIVNTAARHMSGIQLAMAPDARYNFANDPMPGAAGRKAELSPFQKRERCRHCVIYLDHQRHKYALLMPAVLIGVVVAGFLFSPLLREGLRHGLAGIEILMGRFSFGGVGEGFSFRLGRPSPTVEWVLIIGLLIMALSKTLEAVEWAIFKAKI